MISVCGCAINSKYDVKMFAEALQIHNQGYDFEMVVTHDDRVEDGTTEMLTELCQKYKNIKVVRHTHEDTVVYLNRLLDYYDANNYFQSNLRADLRKQVELFDQKKLFDHTRTFLWLTSGLLYDKAIQASSGDIVIVTPSDFLYGFRLKDLEDFVKNNSKDGLFYGKPHAIWGRVSNQRHEWLMNHVKNVHDGTQFREGFRYDTGELFRDFTRCPTDINNYYLADCRNNLLIGLGEPDAVDKMYRFNEESFQHGGIQLIRDFHGFHVLSRKTLEVTGGFSAAFYGRAWADDHMSYNGVRSGNHKTLPFKFSVYWIGGHEISPYRGEHYPDGWQEALRQKDPFYGKHPMPGVDRPVYLHDGLLSNSQMCEYANAFLKKNNPPVKFR